ncbi:MAG: hypothetical protein P1U61_00640 [Legionellaceae bacterium]|nr:hypothetical protein [Legionellaceae bacterium]
MRSLIKFGIKFILVLTLLMGGFHLFSTPSFTQPIITFVCTGNTGRSAMAEYLAKHAPFSSEEKHQFNSRGINTRAAEVMPESNAVAVMQDIGININEHRAKPLTNVDLNQAKLILTMTKAQKDQILQTMAPTAKNVYMLSECADGTQVDIPDAYRQNLSFYRETRDKIKAYIEAIAARGGQCYAPNQ